MFIILYIKLLHRSIGRPMAIYHLLAKATTSPQPTDLTSKISNFSLIHHHLPSKSFI